MPDSVRAKWVIEASGRSSYVLKHFGINRHQFERQMAAIAWFRPDHHDQEATTRVKSVENGWWYTALLPDHTRVVSFQGLPGDVETMVKKKGLFLEEYKKTSLPRGSISQSSLHQGIKARFANISLAEELSGHNWLAVGDASLSLDPLSSQGIFFALYSGVRAAEMITASIETPKLSMMKRHEYKQKVLSVFETNQRARKYYYTLEQWYRDHPYWKQYMT